MTFLMCIYIEVYPRTRVLTLDPYPRTLNFRKREVRNLLFMDWSGFQIQLIGFDE